MSDNVRQYVIIDEYVTDSAISIDRLLFVMPLRGSNVELALVLLTALIIRDEGVALFTNSTALFCVVIRRLTEFDTLK